MKTFVGLRYNHHFVKNNGHSALYLLVGVESEFKKIAINLDWPAKLINEQKGRLLKRGKDDKDVNDYNLIIQAEIGKFNEIFKIYRLSGRELSLQIALQEYQNFDHRTDFLKYYIDKINQRDRRGLLTGGSPRTHRTAYYSLLEFVGKMPLSTADLTVDFIRSYEAYLKRRKKSDGKRLSQDTIVRYLRTLKTYIFLAIDDGLAYTNPFTQGRRSERISLKQNVGKVIFLTPEEYRLIETYYRETPGLTIRQCIWLLRFLIACETDLRISDIKLLGNMALAEFFVNQGKIQMQPRKTHAQAKTWVTIPLSDIAAAHILEHARLVELLATNREKASDQKGNDYLKVVASKVGITKKLHFHLGRHTFATNYLRAGGQLQNLQSLLGHTTITATMRYVHVSEEDKATEIHKLMEFMQQ